MTGKFYNAMALIMRLPLPSHTPTSTRQRGEEVNGLRSRRGAQKGPALARPSFCVSHRIISDSQGGREESSSGSCYVLCPLPRVLHPFPHFLDDLLLQQSFSHRLSCYIPCVVRQTDFWTGELEGQVSRSGSHSMQLWDLGQATSHFRNSVWSSVQ